MLTEDRVFIAGAGPVGLSAAAALVHAGVPVTVFEGASALSRESRASTFHPSTLDMLGNLGVADALVATGLIAPRVQYRTRRDGVIAAFDFAGIADVTRHPYRLQSEQHNLTRIIDGKLRGEPAYAIEFGAAGTSSAPTAHAPRCARRSASSSRASPGRSASSSSARPSTSVRCCPTSTR
jgi:3-(3-hydroxy-phenyl)propionate hydroxylase